ncbi:MAG: FAD/NAD(P)-binding protein [Rhodanobacter sp.]
MSRRIAIIGGGAAAAALLGELLERPRTQSLHLDWYTGGPAYGRGVAYSTASDCHLLNVRAASMSMFTGKPDGFLEFAQRGNSTITGSDFLPRKRYGDYLEAEVTRALQHGNANGHDVHIIPMSVDALVPEPDRITVIHGEESRQADTAVLALGALPAQPLAGVSPAVLSSGRYVVDPWCLMNNIEQVRTAPRKVVLLGLGLTAVDVLLELSARWPQTEFTAVSRHGLLPEAHLSVISAPEGDGAALIESMYNAPEIRRWLQLIREAIGQENDWRTVIDGLRPHVPMLWRTLSTEQRGRFLRHAAWAWQRARHRMPPQVWKAVAALEQSGQLLRRCGRMQSVEMAGDLLRLTMCHAGSTEVLDSEWVIQTVGMDTDVQRTHHPLLCQLLLNGHVLADPKGLGLCTETDGRLLHADGSWPNLFAMGSLLRGTWWESTAMPEIRQQAHRLADLILGQPTPVKPSR